MYSSSKDPEDPMTISHLWCWKWIIWRSVFLFVFILWLSVWSCLRLSFRMTLLNFSGQNDFLYCFESLLAYEINASTQSGKKKSQVDAKLVSKSPFPLRIISGANQKLPQNQNNSRNPLSRLSAVGEVTSAYKIFRHWERKRGLSLLI